MRLPKYTADLSLARPSGRYRASASYEGVSGGVVVPSRFSWINLGFAEMMGHGMPGMTIDEIKADLGIGGGSCDLACGEQRYDCYREGGTTEECEPADAQCRWECFAGVE